MNEWFLVKKKKDVCKLMKGVINAKLVFSSVFPLLFPSDIVLFSMENKEQGNKMCSKDIIIML